MRLPRVLFPVVAALVYQGSQHSSVDPESGCYSSCGGVKAAEYEAGAKSDSHYGDENLDAGHFEFSLFFDFVYGRARRGVSLEAYPLAGWPSWPSRGLGTELLEGIDLRENLVGATLPAQERLWRRRSVPERPIMCKDILFPDRCQF